MDRNQRGSVELSSSPHPGELVSEYTEFLGWSQRDLARRTGLTAKTISMICNGKASIKPDAALRLERVFHRPAHLWLNLQRQYDEFEARKQTSEQYAHWKEWASNFPLEDMERFHYSLGASLRDVGTLLEYFEVSSPESWKSVWDAYHVSYRQTREMATDTWAISAWARETEILANEIETAQFDERLIESLIKSLRTLTRERMDESLKSVQYLFAKAGVAVVRVPDLQTHTGISGCARWLTSRKALIGLTQRYTTDDQFWFALLHMLGHLLLHKSKKSFIVDNAVQDLFDRVIDPEMQQYELEANQFASDALIPPTALGRFLRLNTITRESVLEFAEELDIAPGIVVGRLQHDGYLNAEILNGLKQDLKWQIELT